MGQLIKAIIIWIVGIVYFVVYNTIYGWNKYPINETEETLDYIFKCIMFVGLLNYLAPLFKIYKKKVEELDN